MALTVLIQSGFIVSSKKMKQFYYHKTIVHFCLDCEIIAAGWVWLGHMGGT